MQELPQQIPFQFGLPTEQSFDSFEAGEHTILVSMLKALAEGVGEQQVFLWGAATVGKTHLLSACCNYASKLNRRVAYLPAEMIVNEDVLKGLEVLHLICIDDIERLPKTGQLPLFNLINRARSGQTKMLFASASNIKELSLSLEDLRSRLSWGPVFWLQELMDQQMRSALQGRAASKGLELSDELLEYLLRRLPRDMGSLNEYLDQLDRASMVAKRRLTIPFARQVLNTLLK